MLYIQNIGQHKDHQAQLALLTVWIHK